VATPAVWSEPLAGGTANTKPDLARWWTNFHDAELDSLVARAIRSNLDLRVAEARVREARALRNASVSDFGPTLHSSASYTESQRSENALTFKVSQVHTDIYQAGFDASWEIDIFGGKRRALEATRAELAAADEARRDVLVTLLAEVARNYVEVRGLQRRLTLIRGFIDGEREAVEITQARVKAGLVSELDVMQATTLWATTRAELPLLESALQQGRHRLAVLLGQPPGALAKELETESPVPPVPPEVPVGLPSDLLRRRSDVRRAERELVAANARIGVAVADYFPKLNLTGIAGYQTLSLTDWFSPASRFWTAGPTVTWRIMDTGRIYANIRVQTAREEQARALYEKAVLTSLEEVENALVAYAKEQTRSHLLTEAVVATRRAVELANARYQKGLGDYLVVLDAQRSLYQAEDQLAQSERAVTQGLVSLYKALGGGWENETLAPEKGK
jgi:NodT family efflux transporter outer membrane factor (OMF) lipoprotein